jgi:hypothetical protein
MLTAMTEWTTWRILKTHLHLVCQILVAYWLAMDFHFGQPHHGTWLKKVERLRRASRGERRAAGSLR